VKKDQEKLVFHDIYTLFLFFYQSRQDLSNSILRGFNVRHVNEKRRLGRMAADSLNLPSNSYPN
jgi:hypothetical protein